MPTPWWRWPVNPRTRISLGFVVIAVAIVGLFSYSPAWPSIILGVGLVYLVFGCIDLARQKHENK